jgi:hypothetical protein
MPLAMWQSSHPGRFTDIVSGYRIYEPRLSVLQGARDLASWFSIGTRLDVYWQAFNPSRLFFSGESILNDSTRTAGIFPLAYLLLLPIGAWRLTRRPWSISNSAILLGLLAAPLPSVTAADAAIGRYLMIGPAAALMATAGLMQWWATRSILVRGAGVLAVLSVIVLFRGFYADYMGDWRVRSAMYFGGNLKGAMQRVTSAPPGDIPDAVYLPETIPYADTFLEHYRRAAGR